MTRLAPYLLPCKRCKRLTVQVQVPELDDQLREAWKCRACKSNNLHYKPIVLGAAIGDNYQEFPIEQPPVSMHAPENAVKGAVL